MSGDYTKFSYDPVNVFSGVHKQQGRVSLDSEFIEFEEILDRRDRATTWDTFSQSVTPMTTPAGFQIGGTLATPTIGVGRAYVDGILAECFGDLTTTDRDDVLGRVHGSAAVLYDQQPFFYAPNFPALPALVGDIVYLDVWQREVGVYEHPALREIALNGPDTATRVQTAWQVKIVHGAGATSCAVPLPPAITAASTGRLTAIAAPVAPAPGPCVINPAGGYTGVENRLYRVEIHDAGTLGAGATFKWSRDNASLQATVLSVAVITATDSVITVASTGRDSWMRFEHDDHLELLDDDVELAMRESGQGGTLARITSVNHTTGEIHVAANLAGFVVHPARHPRIRRWDIATPAEPLKRNATNGVPIPLEEGISITFGPAAADTLHAGDYWVFAARTADGSIETLTNEPPRGVLHHFYKLAVATGGAPPFIDCRVFWPGPTTTTGTPPPGPEGCCTKVVHPGESIQLAINGLPPGGGCVCLKAGAHPITATITIAGSNVHLHGESEGAEIQSPGLAPTLAIGTGGHDVLVEDLRFVVDGSVGGGGPVIEIEGAERIGIRGIEIQITNPRSAAPYSGLLVYRSNDVEFADNTVGNVTFGAIALNVAERMWICDNIFGGVLKEVFSLGNTGVKLDGSVAADYRVERNVIRDFVTGVEAAAEGPGAIIRGNRILRGTFPVEGKVPTNTPEQRLYLDGRMYAIELSGGPCTADANFIDLRSPLWGGIRIRTERAIVTNNILEADIEEGQTLVPAGIYCTVDTSGRTGSASTIRGNTLHGPQTGIVISRVNSLEVIDNRIDGTFRGWFGVRSDESSYATIADNLVLTVGFGFSLSDGDHNVVRDNRLAGAIVGILGVNDTQLEVRGNEVTGGVTGGLVALVGRGDVSVAHNRFVNCGWAPFSSGIQGAVFVLSAEVQASGATSQLRVESCEILDAGVAPDGTVATGAVRGIHAWVPNCQILGNRVVTLNERLDPTAEHRALLLIGPHSAVRTFNLTSAAIVTNNVLRGPGQTHLVEFAFPPDATGVGYWFEKIGFTANFCDHLRPAKFAATVQLSGLHIAASANHVTAPPTVVSMDGNGSDRASVVGNVTTGPLLNFPAATPAPIPAFNMQI